MRTTLMLLLCAVFTNAATITSGTIRLGHAEEPPNPFGGFYQIAIAGEGIRFVASLDRSGPLAMSPPLCTGTCAYTFTGTLPTSVGSPNFLLNGIEYGHRATLRVVFSLSIAGTPQTATAVCVDCSPNFRAQTWETVWPVGAFSMTGVISVYSSDSATPFLVENISGSGYASAFSHVELAQADAGSYSEANFVFTPEPSAYLLALMGGALLVVRLRRGHWSAHS